MPMLTSTGEDQAALYQTHLQEVLFQAMVTNVVVVCFLVLFLFVFLILSDYPTDNVSLSIDHNDSLPSVHYFSLYIGSSLHSKKE